MHGFTLVEMLLALAILAALSIAAMAILQNVLRADSLTRKKRCTLRRCNAPSARWPPTSIRLSRAAAARAPASFLPDVFSSQR
jgi:prepilin-type N-terminal cleavage/methylation domain-containing protein